MSNLGQLKTAYTAWDTSKGRSADAWLNIMHDEVRLHSMLETATGLSFAKDRTTKEAVVEYFSSLLEQWEMIHFTPERFITDGDDIAVFGYCAWKNKTTGKDAQVRVAHLWTFKNDKVIDLVEVFDSARAAEAACS